MEGRKVIQDSVHGSIAIDGAFLEIMDRHEMQRLRSVKQLGLGYLIFPGANHTRFEHSLGTYHLAGRMAAAIGLNKEDSDTVRMAGLLHDVCHSPYSHTLGDLMERKTGMGHMDLARSLITGKAPNHKPSDEDILGGAPPVSELMEASGISADMVCNLIAHPDSAHDNLDSYFGNCDHFPSKDYVHQIIHGPIDADQMDYLMRDSHYTGMAHGIIDSDRLINMMAVHNDRIVIRRGGATAAEGLMVSRSLMYTTVYFHDTIKMAERMLVKAVEDSGCDLSQLYLWTDDDLVQNVIASGGRASESVRRILNREINKKAFSIYSEDMDEHKASILLEYAGTEGSERLEEEIADAADVDPFYVCAEVTSRSNLQNSINIGKTDVSIMDYEGKVRSLSRYSSIARSLQARNPYGWAVLVTAPKGIKDKIGKASRKVLGISP